MKLGKTWVVWLSMFLMGGRKLPVSLINSKAAIMFC